MCQLSTATFQATPEFSGLKEFTVSHDSVGWYLSWFQLVLPGLTHHYIWYWVCCDCLVLDDPTHVSGAS